MNYPWWKESSLNLAMGLLCSSWIFWLHIYLPPSPLLLPLALIVCAFLILLFHSSPDHDSRLSFFFTSPGWVHGVGVMGCVIGLAFFPFPYNAGLIPLGLGWTALLLQKHTPFTRRLAITLLKTGLILTLGALLLPPFIAWAARVHSLGSIGLILTYLTSWALKIGNQSVEILSSGGLLVKTFDDYYTLTITLEKLFPIPIALFVGVWLGYQLIFAKLTWRAFWWFGLKLLTFLILRLVILILVMMQRDNPSLFWDPGALTISCLFLALMLGKPFGIKSKKAPVLSHGNQTSGAGGKPLKQPSRSFNSIKLITGILIGGLSFAAFTFRDPGQSKKGAVMINEHGSDWEWTTTPLNTEDYNEQTTYNYYCFAEFIKRYYSLSINTQPLKPEVLAGIDVLILKMPTQPYEPNEIEVVVNYVRTGGSLWVIGDHTNVFGSSSFLNPLLRHFGFSLNYNSTHDLASGNLSLYQKPTRFAHPTVQNLPPYLFATSCSINAPWSAESAILGYGLRADHLDYSQKNFFADRTRKQFDMQFGLFLQQATRTFGKGKVLLYTDSTTFSNFFMFIKGKPELVLGSLDWLNRKSWLTWVNKLCLALALLMIAGMVRWRLWSSATLAGIILGATLGGWTTNSLAKRSFPLPDPIKPIRWINFEREHSNYFLPRLRLAQDKDIDYLTFFVWTQRVGAMPREIDHFTEAISGDNPVVMINPASELTAQETQLLKDYLQRGGRLVVISSVDQIPKPAQQILSNFGISLRVVAAAADSAQTLTRAGRYFPLVVSKSFAYLEGGEVFLRSDQGKAIGVAQQVGQGQIFAFSCGHLFRNNYMGQTATVPDAGLKSWYEVEFNLIIQLLESEGLKQ